MNNNEKVMESIDFKALFDLFVKRLPVMVLAAAVAVGLFFAYDTFTYEPQYESTAVLYVLKQNTDGTDLSSSDFSLALQVTSDCTILLKSHSVLDATIEELQLNTSYEKLYSSVTTSNPANSRILNVVVKSNSPENAKRIVDKICEIGVEQIEQAMGFRQVNFYEHGTYNPKPCNRTSLMVYLVIGVAAAVVVYLIFAAKLIFDDRINSDEDIEKFLDLAIIGVIPDANATSGKKYGRYGKYGRYAKYGNYGKYGNEPSAPQNNQ